MSVLLFFAQEVGDSVHPAAALDIELKFNPEPSSQEGLSNSSFF